MDPGALPSPLDFWDLAFARMALAELTLLAISGGLLGVFVVLRRLAFFAHAVGTSTFPALVVADATGFSATAAGLASAAAYAGGAERAGRSARDPGDSATGLLLVAALGGGILLASDVFESGAGVDRLLFGTAIGLDGSDIVLSGAAAILALAATGLYLSLWLDVAPGPAVAVLGAATYAVCAIGTGLRRGGRVQARTA